MRGLIVWGWVIGALTATVAMAQPLPPNEPRDGTQDVRSQQIGVPGTLNDPMSAYEQQRSLNNLPAQKAAEAKYGRARPAKANEITAGASVNDNTGIPVATITEVDPDGVVLAMGASKIKVPAEALGHNKAGLLVDMSKTQFAQVVAQANAAH